MRITIALSNSMLKFAVVVVLAALTLIQSPVRTEEAVDHPVALGDSTIFLHSGWVMDFGGSEIPIEQTLTRTWRNANPRQACGNVNYRICFDKPFVKGDLLLSIGQQRVVEQVALNGTALTVVERCSQPDFRYGQRMESFVNYFRNDAMVSNNQNWNRPAIYLVPANLLQENNTLQLKVYDIELSASGLPFGEVRLYRPALPDRIVLSQNPTELTRSGNSDIPAAVFDITNRFTQDERVSESWHVEDYFGKILRKGSSDFLLKAGETIHREIPAEIQDDYKIIYGMDSENGSIRNYWTYFPVMNKRQGVRKQISLNGSGWERKNVPFNVGLKVKPDNTGWKPAEMPLSISGNSSGGTHRMWLRRELKIPADFKGSRISLKLGYVSCFATVYLNDFDAPVYDGTGDFPEIDLSEKAKPGSTNTLYVGVTDATGWAKPELGPIDDRYWDGSSQQLNNNLIGESNLRPWTWWGMRGSISLQSKPEIQIEHVFIRTNVSQQKLWVKTRIANTTNTDVEIILKHKVLYKGEDTLACSPEKVCVPAGGLIENVTETAWQNPKLWSPFSPELYQLHTEILPAVQEKNAGLLDVTDNRFGVREFAIDKDKFLLNGHPFHPYGSSGRIGTFWTVGQDPHAGIDVVRSYHARNATYSREWFSYTQAENIDLFDEVGIVICMESNQDSGTDFTDPRTFTNWGPWMKRVVDEHYNRPSIMFWNAGNEIVPEDKPMDRLSGIGATMKELKEYDPTRLVMSQGSGDIGGLAEIYAPHYPLADVLPDDYYWLGTPLSQVPQSQIQRRKAVWNEGPAMVYRPNCTSVSGWPRTKPMFPAEFSYQSETAPGFGAGIIGEESYCPGPLCDDIFPLPTTKALNTSRLDKYAALRILGVSGLCGHLRTYQGFDYINPVAAFLHEPSVRFFSGQNVKRTAYVFNDLCARKTLTFAWDITVGDNKLQHNEMTITLDAGTCKIVPFEFVAPQAEDQTFANLRLCVSSEDGHRFEDTKRLSIFPHRKFAQKNMNIAVYDPSGISVDALAKAGLSFRTLDQITPELLNKTNLLIVGDGAADGQIERAAGTLSTYVRSGGHVLVMRQETVRPWLPVRNLSLGDNSGSFAAITAQGHPVLRGLLQEDFKCWDNGEGSLVYSLAMHMPTGGGFRALIRGGKASGDGDCNHLDDLCLMEIPFEKGWYLCTQLELTPATLANEPAALQLVQNIIDYANVNNAEVQDKKIALLTPSGILQEYLENEIGVVFDLRADTFSALGSANAFGTVMVTDWKSADRLTAATQGVREYVENGGRLVINTPDGDMISFLNKQFGLSVKAEAFACPRVVKTVVNPLLWGVSNDDLAWNLSEHNQSYEDRKPSKTDILRMQPVGDSVVPMTYPALFSKISFGKGEIILDMGRWTDRPQRETVLSTFCVNLGAKIRPKGVLDSDQGKLLRNFDLFPIKLAPFCNRGFKDEGPTCVTTPVQNTGKKRGWSAQGAEKDLREFPTGKQTFCGVPFWIINPDDNDGGGCIALWNKHDGSLPEAVKAIPVGRKVDSLFFLHSSCWNSGGGKPGWKYLIHYKGFKDLIMGQDPASWTQPFEIKQGIQVGEWSNPSTLPEAVVAWQGRNLTGWSVCVFMAEWKNPYPDREIESIDIISGNNDLYPLIVAITAAVKKGTAK